MSEPTLKDRFAFVLAVHRVAPAVWPSLVELPASRPLWAVRAWLARHGLSRPGLEWLEGDIRSDVSPPESAAKYPDAWVPAIAGPVPTHDQARSLAWEPAETGEDRQAFRARALAALDAYADDVEEWAEERGLSRPEERADREVEPGLARWDLLASRLVLGMTYEAIGAEIGISRQAAKRHVKTLADRLGVNAT